MKQRDLNLEAFEISRFAYRELKYFCLQYQEKKQRLMSLYGLSATNYDGMPHGIGISTPTENKGVMAAQLSKDCGMIERAANQAAGSIIYPYLMKNVTQGIPFYCLDIPCGERQFKNMRRYFYYLLAKELGKV